MLEIENLFLDHFCLYIFIELNDEIKKKVLFIPILFVFELSIIFKNIRIQYMSVDIYGQQH